MIQKANEWITSKTGISIAVFHEFEEEGRDITFIAVLSGIALIVCFIL